MTNISNLKREIRIVQKALSRDKQGYDEDGYNEEGFDRYGRSREMMEQSRKYDEMAFNSLNSEEQALVLKANEIMWKYKQKAIEWESQPLEVRERSPFYEEYMYHSDITKHSFLIGLWLTKEEDELTTRAFRVLLKARKKFDPYYVRHRGIH